MQTPKDHQVEAISACVAGLKTPGSRGQCIMACGTGKTLVGHEVAKGLEARRVLVLVPSLLLVNQMLSRYKEYGATNLLCVCCDESAAGEDAIHVSVRELAAENTTDANRVQEFLADPGQRFVVSTYQSLRPLSEVMSALEFDLAIFDEAHKTAGKRSKLFAHGLTDDSVKCARRLFMTATPRHAALKEDGEETQVFAMNDPKVYGPVLYSLSLRTAIEAGIIDDYRVIIALVDKKEDAELRDQAVRVAIDQAREAYGINKVFAFHARIADSKDFVLGATSTLKGMQLYHIDGTQSSTERALKLEAFGNADAAMVSNARCLTEGVDLPAADMVAFLAPKRNPIDIIQTTGRVLRKHASKATGGYVFIPVFVCEGEDEEQAIAESKWAGAYEVLQALREHDEPLAAALSRCARGDGDLPEKIIVMDGRAQRMLGAGADITAMSEGMRRAIRVRLVRPFSNRGLDTEAELLARAQAGESKPLRSSVDPHERFLAKALTRLRRKMRPLIPQWFRGETVYVRAAQMKAEILQVRQAGKIPSALSKDPHEVRLATATGRYCSPRSRAYDHGFHQKIIEIRNGKKKEKRPRRISLVKEKMTALLQLARSGQPRPSSSSKDPRVRVLGQALTSYTSPKSAKYKLEFDHEIRSTAPQWFGKLERNAANVSELLRMARAKEPRPSTHSNDIRERGLANTLQGLVKNNWEGAIMRELRTIVPHWFSKKRNGQP